ncbi:MAG: hypothetical protein JSV77_08950 [Dehalococcoidales bacterium]|nr:MAG: hypothetical protein JSV77_08950 [Dehalococcoidales bacterium]
MKETLYEQSETGCCPRFNPEPWDNRVVAFEDKLFLKDHVRSFLHIPLNIGRVMAKNMTRIEEAGALAPEQLVLSDEKSLWGSDIYIAVSKEVPGVEMTRMSGTFLSKVFEGPYSKTGKWVREMKAYVESEGKEFKDLYFFYTTCPSCAKAYGKNYTVLLAAV